MIADDEEEEDEQFNRTFKHNVSIISPRPGDFHELPDDENEGKGKKKGKRSSITMKVPFFGGKKKSSGKAEGSTSSG